MRRVEIWLLSGCPCTASACYCAGYHPPKEAKGSQKGSQDIQKGEAAYTPPTPLRRNLENWGGDDHERDVNEQLPHTKLTQRVRQVDMTSSKPAQVMYKWPHIGKATIHMAGRSKPQQINQFIKGLSWNKQVQKCKPADVALEPTTSNETCTPTPSTHIYLYIYIYTIIYIHILSIKSS